MKKVVIGYIYSNKRLSKDERLFLKEAEKRNIQLATINLLEEFDLNKIKEKLKDCKYVFNNSAEEFAFEVVKTLEEFGKIVIDSSMTYYYDEDKWMFFLKCKKFKIPTPNTILLSENINLAKEEIRKFNNWPVILKRIQGSNGEFVARAKNLNDAEKIIKKFWKKGSEKLPIIAQEFIESSCYRIMTLDGKVVQTAVKESRMWKKMYVPSNDRKVKRIKIDKELKEIIQKIMNAFKITICGIDLFKKDGKWLVCEINSSPGLDFLRNERRKLVGKILDYLKKKSNHTASR